MNCNKSSQGNDLPSFHRCRKRVAKAFAHEGVHDRIEAALRVGHRRKSHTHPNERVRVRLLADNAKAAVHFL